MIISIIFNFINSYHYQHLSIDSHINIYDILHNKSLPQHILDKINLSYISYCEIHSKICDDQFTHTVIKHLSSINNLSTDDIILKNTFIDFSLNDVLICNFK
jgi:hypothetical protein